MVTSNNILTEYTKKDKNIFNFEDSMKFAFYTLGCKVNQYETQTLIEKVITAGHSVVPFAEFADVYVINTCSVTAESDRKSRQIIGRAKKKNPNAIVCALGCYVQTAGAKSPVFEGIDIAVGNTEKQNLLRLIESTPTHIETDNKKYIPYVPDFASGMEGKTRAVIKIEDGCNNFCSYCIIPYARGRVASKPFEDAVREFRGLVGGGMNEIVVTGIEIASYGADTGDRLIDLLCEFDKACEGTNTRIRLGSLEPRIITEEFAKTLSTLSHICPHFHLSMQSGCDETLRRMNRKYDTARFALSASLLRKYFPDVMLTTDLIVGFPDETDEEFTKTLEFLRKIKFLKVHIFPYSVRQGTPAAKMKNQVEPEVKSARCAQADKLCEGIREELLRAYIGTEAEVLFETKKGKTITGYTKNYIPVTVNDTAAKEDTFGKVLITDLYGEGLYGTLA